MERDLLSAIYQANNAPILLHNFDCIKLFSLFYVMGVIVLHPTVWSARELQALVYDILPSTTAVFRYAMGSRKLSANEQFFVGAQSVVSLLQTTQIISDVCFITDHVAYASSNKTKIV